MLRSIIVRAGLVLALALTGAVTALAQAPASQSFEGTINDYSDTQNAAGPWHITGEWSAKIKGNSLKADFVASLAMLRAGSGASPHTHHVGLIDAEVTAAAGGTGYVIRGPATLTGNGSLAGFNGSFVTVTITGGTALLPSNITITFEGGAAGHFGAAPIDGVVTVKP